MEMAMTKAPSDLQEHIARLTKRGLVTRIDRPIDKDSEASPSRALAIPRWTGRKIARISIHECCRRSR